MEQMKKYIAYGSNLHLGQMRRRCPTAKVVGKGEIMDYELLFRGHRDGAVATVEPKVGSRVPVLIWEIGEKDERNLNFYEGYPRFYGKQDLKVQTEDGCEFIMAYVMNAGHDIGLPASGYLNTILEGYRTAEFDTSMLMASLKHCEELFVQELAEVKQEGGAWGQHQQL